MATPVTTVINGYTFIATLDVKYGLVKYVVNNPDGSELFYANGASSVFGGLRILSAKAEAAGDTTLADTLKQTQIGFNNQSASIDQAAIAANPPPPPVDTAAGDVKSSPDGATQNPPGNIPNTPNTETNTPPNTLEVGTNGRLRPLTETQSIPASSTGPKGVVSPPLGDTEGQNNQNSSANMQREAGGQPGVGATGDDSGTAAITKVIVDNFNGKITPQDNVLDKYASYTYNIGWYLLEPGTYGKLLSTQKPSLAGYQLLAQSGGAPVTSATSGATADSGRNQFFQLDYYLDNLELESWIAGGGTLMAHNVSKLRFTVTEPNGVTLFNNLYQAVQSVYKEKLLHYSFADYALVIRFYGYDENGKIVQVGQNGNSNTDRQAVVEKFYPFKINSIKFRIANKLVEYSVEGTAIPYNIGFGVSRGTIKQPMELSGATVADILSGVGNASNSNSNSPVGDGRTSSPTPSTNQVASVLPSVDKASAAIAAGTQDVLVNNQGMAFGGGGL